MDGIRYANIGIAVATAFIVIGVFLLRDAGDAVLQAIGLTGFVLGAVVYRGLDARDQRRRQRNQ